MSKFICPYCNRKHTVESCGMKCVDGFYSFGTGVCKCGVTRDSYGWIPQLSKKKCEKCNLQSILHYYCPELISSDGQMTREIPVGFLINSANNFPISLIGTVGSGKSIFLGVLINEIKKKMPQNFNCSLDLMGEETQSHYNEDYYRPLYEMHEVIDKTYFDEISPLIFSLGFYNSKNVRKNVAPLTFYDTADEIFDSNDSMEVFNRYIPNSKGIVLFIDPLQIPSIRKQLEGKMPMPAINTDATEILGRVIQNIRKTKNIKGTIKIPLAVVISKIDVLEQFDILPKDSCLRKESEHLKHGALIIKDIEKTNNEMQSHLEDWLGFNIILMIKQFSKSAIFGVSSLGGIPNEGGKLSNEEIHPKNVLDPFLWLLAENKYIKTIK